MHLGKGFRLRSSWAGVLRRRRTPKGLNVLRPVPQLNNIAPLQDWWSLNQPSPISITGVGNIASAETFGTPAISLQVSPSSISSSEEFGNPSLSLSLVGAGGIASGEQFGTPLLELNISAIGIVSGEAFGLPTIIDASNVNISGVGNIVSQEAFGLPTISSSSPIPVSSFRVGGGGSYDPYYWDKVRQKREEEEIMVLV